MICMQLTQIDHKYYSNSKVYHALKNVTLDINEGEKIAIIGHSGSGKSTLVNILGCLITPSSGTYKIYGENINLMSDRELATTIQKYFGVIFQNYNLIKRLNVADNIAFPLIYDNYTAKDMRELAERAMVKIGISDLKDKKPNELSGGQQQLVAIARAIVKNPKILIADEPTANLDVKTEKRIMDIFEEINAGGTTLLTIMHNPLLIDRYNRTIHITNGVVKDRSGTSL